MIMPAQRRASDTRSNKFKEHILPPITILQQGEAEQEVKAVQRGRSVCVAEEQERLDTIRETLLRKN